MPAPSAAAVPATGLWDTHVHLTMEPFREDLPAVLQRARDAGVERFITIGLEETRSKETWQAALDLALTHDDMYCALAIHPHDASIAADAHFQRFRELYAQHPGKIVAVGEAGLDYFYDFSPRPQQQDVFRRFIRLARELALPLIIHSRDAWNDTLRILDEEHAEEVGGVFHCYGYGPDEAREALARNFLLGIGGVATFKRSDALRQAACCAGIDRLLLETDGPYLAPVPFRGQRNEPAYIPRINAALAATLQLPPEMVAATTGGNAARLFLRERE